MPDLLGKWHFWPKNHLALIGWCRRDRLARLPLLGRRERHVRRTVEDYSSTPPICRTLSCDLKSGRFYTGSHQESRVYIWDYRLAFRGYSPSDFFTTLITRNYMDDLILLKPRKWPMIANKKTSVDCRHWVVGISYEIGHHSLRSPTGSHQRWNAVVNVKSDTKCLDARLHIAKGEESVTAFHPHRPPEYARHSERFPGTNMWHRVSINQCVIVKLQCKSVREYHLVGNALSRYSEDRHSIVRNGDLRPGIAIVGVK